MTVPTRWEELDGTNTILISIYTKDFFNFTVKETFKIFSLSQTSRRKKSGLRRYNPTQHFPAALLFILCCTVVCNAATHVFLAIAFHQINYSIPSFVFIKAPSIRPRRASGTPCPTTLQIAVNKSEEREELRWSLNTTCCSILYLCLLHLRVSVQSCYDVIVLFTLVINCFK